MVACIEKVHGIPLTYKFLIQCITSHEVNTKVGYLSCQASGQSGVSEMLTGWQAVMGILRYVAGMSVMLWFGDACQKSEKTIFTDHVAHQKLQDEFSTSKLRIR